MHAWLSALARAASIECALTIGSSDREVVTSMSHKAVVREWRQWIVLGHRSDQAGATHPQPTQFAIQIVLFFQWDIYLYPHIVLGRRRFHLIRRPGGVQAFSGSWETWMSPPKPPWKDNGVPENACTSPGRRPRSNLPT